MRMIPVTCRDGKEENICAYSIEDFPWHDLRPIAMKTRKRSKKPAEYLIEFGTFDIETTTVKSDSPYGFMYHWQMCIAGKCLVGRTWKECMEAFRKVADIYDTSDARRFVWYIQNEGFEFQFFRDFIERDFGWSEIFAIKERRPLRCLASNGLEFRCSYLLSNMSLEKMTETTPGVRHPKQAGDLDYKVLRTPSTPLTDKEMAYCICDVLGLWEYICCKLQEEGDTLENIPMTSTGYIRRKCRRSTEKEKGYRDFFKSLKITPSVYELLKEAARGGDTHANRKKAGKIHKSVDSYDVQSSYPYVMCCKEFPITKFTPYGDIESMDELNGLLANKACLFRVLVEKVDLKDNIAMPYLSESKCIKYSNPLLDNGRLISADYVYMTVTDIDWDLFNRQYDYDRSTVSISDMHIAEYGPLPESIKSVIRELFNTKCDLKYRRDQYEEGTKEYEDLDYLYGKCKNLLNGIFGMMYTDPVRDIITWDGEEWKKERPDIGEKLDKFWSSRNSFLYYPWGIWTTAHARRHLADLIELEGQENAIYSDTDSGKGVNIDERRIEIRNAEIVLEAEQHGAFGYGGSIKYYMGIYEKDAHYEEFITLGAKKYAYTKRNKDTGKNDLHITVSGVRKGGAKELKSIRNFKRGFIFRESAGMEFYYNDCKIHTIQLNNEVIETASNVGMVDGTYTLNLKPEYADLIDYDIMEDF